MEAEGHLHELQLRFGDPAVFKDSKAVADVKKEIANIEKDLARLNEEYARR